jgi:hypothetical protein
MSIGQLKKSVLSENSTKIRDGTLIGFKPETIVCYLGSFHDEIG